MIVENEGGPRITSLEPGQEELQAAIGASLGRAFQDEPNFTYMLPSPDRRRRALPWFFGSFVTRLGLRLGAVDVVNGGAGAAIWLRPGASVTPRVAIRSGMLAMPLRFGLMGMRRSQQLAQSVEGARTELMPRPHWYLMALGVDPNEQGKGLGRALLEAGLARAYQARAPSYLETFRASTAEFYDRYGFEVVSERKIGRSGPRFFAMRR